jgi:hypothetical protein
VEEVDAAVWISLDDLDTAPVREDVPVAARTAWRLYLDGERQAAAERIISGRATPDDRELAARAGIV